MYCNRSCLWVCLCVGGSVTMITRNCVHRSSPNWVCIGKGIDQLYLIKFWSSRAPEGGSAAGDFFGSALLYKRAVRKLLGLRRPYFFLSMLAHRLNFVVGVTLGLRWSYSFASTLGHRLNFVVGLTTTAVWVSG